MDKTTSIILDEVVRNKNGEVIASKEFVNELIRQGKIIKRVTREIIKLARGKVVINRVIHCSRKEVRGKVESINLLTGLIEKENNQKRRKLC